MRKQSCSGSCHKFALQPFFRAQCLLGLAVHGLELHSQVLQSRLTWDSQNERKEDAAGVSFLVVSQHRLSKQKIFLVQRTAGMAVTVSERLQVQSVASALQAGTGCVESVRKRKKPVKATIAAARFPHPEALLERKLPSVLCVYSAALLLLFRCYTFPILNIYDLNSIPL